MSDEETDVETALEEQLKVAKPRVPWGRLVRVDDPAKTVDLFNQEIQFGRLKADHKEKKGGPSGVNEHSLLSDKRTSSKHFRVFLDGSPEEVFIEDTSSNGTYVNGVQLEKGKKRPLENGDEITLFAAKYIDSIPLFVFQDKRKGKANETVLERTERAPEPQTKQDPGKRRLEEAEEVPGHRAKRQATEVLAENKFLCGICNRIMHRCVSLSPCNHTFCCSCIIAKVEQGPLTCPTCRVEIQGAQEQQEVEALIAKHLQGNPALKRSEEEIAWLEGNSDVAALNALIKEDDKDPGSSTLNSSIVDEQCATCKKSGGAKSQRLGACRVQQIPKGIFGGNESEKKVLEKYLEKRSLSIENCFRECIKKLDGKEWRPSKASKLLGLSSKSVCCEQCVPDVLSDLFFEYLKTTPKTDLPREFANRPDCYYGRNCRSQRHNQPHQAKYNHICEQTKN